MNGADGNQTRVKTATGIWQVSYNGENRPVRWQQGRTVITMSYDRMGRRVTKNDQRFVYNGYLQIANFRSTTTTSDYNYFVWDPTEPVATRPLAWSTPTTNHESPITNFYTHDGNKNVSEVIASDNEVAAHYEYAPFGALTVSRGASAAANPWRFSSEYAEDETVTVYYNYRHYEPVTGRWMSRDPIEENFFPNLFVFIGNAVPEKTDSFGLFDDGGGQRVCMEHKLEIKIVDSGLSFQWVCVYWKTIKGHKDFENNGTVCPFDYTKEDWDWRTAPWFPWGRGGHFKTRQEIVGGTGASDHGHYNDDSLSADENLLRAAIGECDSAAFQSLMHRLQDTRVHNGNGFKSNNWSWRFPFWEPGHAWHLGDPDHNDESQGWRWNVAEEDTHYYVNLWKNSCQLKDPCECAWEKSGKKGGN